MKKLYMLTAAVVFAGLITQGEVVGYYSFGGKSKASADSETNSVAGDMVVGAGVTTFKWETRDFWSPTQPSAAFNAGTDFADETVLDDDYFSFTITPEPGKTLDFTSLSFIDRSGGFSVSIASDQDSFASVLDSTAAAGSWATNTLDLSGLADTSGAIELRIYFHNGSGDPRMIDNVTINADISTGGPLPPATPTGLAATPGNGSVSLDWDDNSESGVTYSVYRSTTSGNYADVLTSGLTTSDFVDNTVSNYTTYYYVVSATDTGSNKSPKSDEVSATPSDPDDTTAPAAPTGLTAVGGAGSIALNWDDSTEVDLVSYSVYRSTNSGSYGSALTNGLTSSDYVDSTTEIGTIYYYVVAAVDYNGNESEKGGEVSGTPDTTPPAAPPGLAAVADDSAIVLDWADNTEGDLASYSIYRSTTSGVYGVALNTGIGSSKYFDSTTVNGTTYYYVVTAVDSSGNESAQSEQASETPVLKYFAKYTFSGSSYASSDVMTNSTASDLVHGGGLGVSFETRQPWAAWGNPIPSLKWDKANANDETILDTDYLAFSITNNSSESLTFGSLSFDFSGDAGQYIYVFSSQDGFSSLGDAVGAMRGNGSAVLDNYTISLAGMTNAAGWSVTEFRLYSRCSGSGEVWIDNIKLDITPTSSGSDIIPPEAPTGLTATPGDAQVSLDWDDSTEDDFDTYTVYRAATSGGYSDALVTNLTSSSYVDTNAVNGTTYYYVVTATDTSGNESEESNEDSATPEELTFSEGYIQWLSDNEVEHSDETFYEYAMDGDPNDGLPPANIPELVRADGSLYYVHPQRTDDIALTYTVETSTNLLDPGLWSATGYTVGGTLLGGTLNYVSNLVDTAESERFIRLKIEQ